MYQVDVLIQGFPGRALFHGGLGWSTISLLRGEGRVILIDVGAFGVRKNLLRQLQAHGVTPDDVTDVVLTHAHYDHAVNFTLFPRATVWIGAEELAWAAAQPPGFDPLPELYVQELSRSPRVRRIREGDVFLPGLHCLQAPGHTPGHLVFHLPDNAPPVVFSGDAAKNRAELVSRTAKDTDDAAQSARSIARIWEVWRRHPDTVLIPGHDLSMVLDASGEPAYVGELHAAIATWFAEHLDDSGCVDLCCGHPAGAAPR